MTKCLYCEAETNRSLPFCSERCSDESFSRTARRIIAKKLPAEDVKAVISLARKRDRLIRRGCHYGSGVTPSQLAGSEDRDINNLELVMSELNEYYKKFCIIYPDLTKKEFSKWIA